MSAKLLDSVSESAAKTSFIFTSGQKASERRSLAGGEDLD